MYLGKNFILNVVFGQIDAVHAAADHYLMITAASIPLLPFITPGRPFPRAGKFKSFSMKVSMMMNAINVTGNAILVYGFLMGVAGVAIPTLVSRAFAGIVILIPLADEAETAHRKAFPTAF